MEKLEENNLFEPIQTPNHIASIKNTIEHLATKQGLLDKEIKLKNEFKQIFEPIPHIDRLPPHEPAHIHLKDAYKKIELIGEIQKNHNSCILPVFLIFHYGISFNQSRHEEESPPAAG